MWINGVLFLSVFQGNILDVIDCFFTLAENQDRCEHENEHEQDQCKQWIRTDAFD
jgi:hypothetical protein